MITFIVALLLIGLALVTLLLLKVYAYLPLKELKRQAAHEDAVATALYRAAAYGRTLQLTLWLIIGLATAGGFLLFDRLAPPILGFSAVALTLWVAFLWLPRSRLTGVEAQAAVLVTPLVVWLLRALHPLLQHASKPGRDQTPVHT